MTVEFDSTSQNNYGCPAKTSKNWNQQKFWVRWLIFGIYVTAILVLKKISIQNSNKIKEIFDPKLAEGIGYGTII